MPANKLGGGGTGDGSGWEINLDLPYKEERI